MHVSRLTSSPAGSAGAGGAGSGAWPRVGGQPAASPAFPVGHTDSFPPQDTFAHDALQRILAEAGAAHQNQAADILSGFGGVGGPAEPQLQGPAQDAGAGSNAGDGAQGPPPPAP